SAFTIVQCLVFDSSITYFHIFSYLGGFSYLYISKYDNKGEFKSSYGREDSMGITNGCNCRSTVICWWSRGVTNRIVNLCVTIYIIIVITYHLPIEAFEKGAITN